MNHRIILSNGSVCRLEEDKDSLHIALESQVDEGDVETYICELTPSGVLVMPNSCDVIYHLTMGLTKSEPGRF